MMQNTLDRGTFTEKLQTFGQLSPNAQAGCVGSLIANSSANAPDQVQAWVKDLPPGLPRTRAVESLVAQQATNSPDRLDALVENWPAAHDRDAALAGIVEAFGVSKPQQSVEYIRRISDPGLREGGFEDLAFLWSYRDPVPAGAWIASTPDLTAEQKRVISRQIAER